MDDDDDHEDLHASFEGGENIGRRGEEVESDANWVPSYAGEAGNEVEENEEEEKEAADDATSARQRVGKGKVKADETLEVEEFCAGSDGNEELDKMETGDDYNPNGDDVGDENKIADEGTSKSAQKLPRKRKSDDSDGEKSRRCRDGSFRTNRVSFQVHEPDGNDTRTPWESSDRKRRRSRKEKTACQIDAENENARWAKSLRGPQLRLMQALKELGTERVNTIKEDSLYNCLTPAALRVIGIILEEHVKERFSLLGSEEPGDGGERLRSGNSSSSESQQRAGNGHTADAIDDMGTDMEDMSKKRGKS